MVSLREFLQHYNQAKNLDDKDLDTYFPSGVKRADFSIFDNRIICEVKEFTDIDFPLRVKKNYSKPNSDKNLKRDLYAPINKAISDANKQIGDSKSALSLTDALGLVILENKIPKDCSGILLIDAADRKMQSGCQHIDCIFCIDRTNIYRNRKGEASYLSQVCSRKTDRSRELSKLIVKIMKDYSVLTNIPINEGYNLKSAKQEWIVDDKGTYNHYKASIDFK